MFEFDQLRRMEANGLIVLMRILLVEANIYD